MQSNHPCSICQEGGHTAAKCPELYHPERASGGGGGHDHDDDDEKAACANTVTNTVTNAVTNAITVVLP